MSSFVIYTILMDYCVFHLCANTPYVLIVFKKLCKYHNNMRERVRCVKCPICREKTNIVWHDKKYIIKIIGKEF